MPDGILKKIIWAYGGWLELFSSLYFISALILTALLFPEWSEPGWWERPLSVLPNVIGFSLGGFALWLAIGDDGFRTLITEEDDNDDEPTAYYGINGSFVVFITVQVLAIFSAIFADAYNFVLPKDSVVLLIFGDYFYLLCLFGSGVGYFLFVYSLLLALSTTVGLFRITGLYQRYLNSLK